MVNDERSATGRIRPSFPRWVALAAAVVLLVAAFAVLHRELRQYSVPEIVADIRGLAAWRVVLALFFTFLGYLGLSGYDWLAAGYVGAGLSYRRVGFASFVGYAFAQSLGFPLLTGGAVRYRLYSAWGVDPPDIARMVGFASVTLWVGFLALTGGVFLVDPPAPPAPVAPWGIGLRALGALLLGASAAYLVWCAVGPRKLRILGWDLLAPSIGTGIRQLVVSSLDWACAGAALYVLLPGSPSLRFLPFLATFLLAQMLGVLSHVPGGLGVFEAVLVTLLPGELDGAGVVTSLVVFRGVYYFAPLVLATASLGAFELQRRKDALEVVGAGLSAVVPLLASGAVFLAGAVLMVSGALPLGSHPLGVRLELPLFLLEAAHFLGSVAGAALLVLAWGLARRLDGAYHATIVLLGGSALLSFARGAGLPASLLPLAVMVALLPTRKEFFRRSTLTADPLSPEWTFGVVAVVLATAWLGFFAYREVAYSGDLWWQFAADADAPRFLRATVGAALVLLSFAIARLLTPAEPEEAGDPAPVTPEIEALVAASSHPLAHLALLGDKSFILSESGRSFVMYGVEGKAWVSMGDPIGVPEELAEVVWRFRTRVYRHGGWPVFYQVRPEYLSIYVDAGLRLIKLGEEAVVPTDTFSLEGGRRSRLRQAVRRVEKDGATFRVVHADEVRALLPELRAVSDRWLAAKSTREKGFSMGSFDEGYLSRFPVAVVEVDARVVAFANVWPGAPGTEYSVDLMRYDPETAPQESMTYVFVKLMEWGREAGYVRFSLGMAPLSGLATGRAAPLWGRLGSAVFRYGEHFYNFQGLRSYKEKFDPVWEPRYVAYPGGAALPRVLAGISALVSGGVRGILTR